MFPANSGGIVQQNYPDALLENKIAHLQNAVETWALRHDVWHDCGFQSFKERVDAEPGEEPVVTIMYYGEMGNVLDGMYEDDLSVEFDELLKGLGFWYERNDGCSAHIYAIEGGLKAAYRNYFHWQWICGLVQSDFDDVYEELYGHFRQCPEDLYRLRWRDFETLLFQVFRNQGFNPTLGPGSGDEGVDIKLLQPDPLGDILTFVQVKKYQPQSKIKLEAVQALHGASVADSATQSIFITTSDYLPSARRFAARENVPMQLWTSKEVTEWCARAEQGIIKDKSVLISPSSVEKLLAHAKENHRGKVLHTTWGYKMTINSFALILKETKNAALLMSLPKMTVSHDGYGQRGTEVPDIGPGAMSLLNSQTVWRAKRTPTGGFWDGSHLFGPWNGMPCHFDHCD